MINETESRTLNKTETKIFMAEYTYSVRDEEYKQTAWFIEQNNKRSQPLTWHEAVGMVNQLMMEQQLNVPVYWESKPEKYKIAGRDHPRALGV